MSSAIQYAQLQPLRIYSKSCSQLVLRDAFPGWVTDIYLYFMHSRHPVVKLVIISWELASYQLQLSKCMGCMYLATQLANNLVRGSVECFPGCVNEFYRLCIWSPSCISGHAFPVAQLDSWSHACIWTVNYATGWLIT